MNDYHQAFGLLFDVLTDILGLAKQDDEDSDNSEMGRLLFAALAAMSQHCAEDMQLCAPDTETLSDDQLSKTLCQIIVDLLAEIQTNARKIDNPNQNNSYLNMTSVSDETINNIKEFLSEHQEILPTARP